MSFSNHNMSIVCLSDGNFIFYIFGLLKDLDSFAETCLFLVPIVNVSNIIYWPLSFFCSFKMQWNYGFSAASISSSLISSLFFTSISSFYLSWRSWQSGGCDFLHGVDALADQRRCPQRTEVQLIPVMSNCT